MLPLALLTPAPLRPQSEHTYLRKITAETMARDQVRSSRPRTLPRPPARASGQSHAVTSSVREGEVN